MIGIILPCSFILFMSAFLLLYFGKDVLKKQTSCVQVANTSTSIKQKQVTLTKEAIIPETQAQEKYVVLKEHASSSNPTIISKATRAFEQILESQETQTHAL